MASFRLKPGLLLGAATAATQIEGGDANNSWYDWYGRGKIKDQTSPARANDHYQRWAEDLDLMQTMGLQVYRLGIEWSRIEPENGRFDAAALDHYRTELQAIRAGGIRPLLTLHHFTNPRWFEAAGAFSDARNIPVFLRFVTAVIQALGDLVSEYITINEPNVYATLGYAAGDWPPGQQSLPTAMRVMSNLAACHIQAYQLIHEQRLAMGFTDTRVSFAHHMRVFAPRQAWNPWHQAMARLARYLFQDSVAQACFSGRFPWPLQRPRSFKRPEGIQPRLYSDFIALNYYTRSTVSGLADGVRRAAPVNDLGWEIYAPGIVACARDLYRHYRLPIYITENGTCDNHDTFRSRYIFEHLQQLCASELPVERYYHWCFCDNFEWLEGESARFGLVHVDYASQQRTVKASGRFFAEIIRQGGVDEALYQTACRQPYHTQTGELV